MNPSTRPALRSCLIALTVGMAFLSVAACIVLWRAFGSRGLPLTTASPGAGETLQRPSGFPPIQANPVPAETLVGAASPTQPSGSSLYLPALQRMVEATAPALPTPAIPQNAGAYPQPATGGWVEDTLAAMTLEQKVGQLIITGVPGYEINTEACDQVKATRPAGVTFQWDNAKTPEQVRQLTVALRDCISAVQPVPPFFTIAHEGEYIQRFDSQVTTFPTALGIGAAGDVQLAHQIGLATGQELAFSGINMVLAPVADVLLEPDNQVIALRTFGSDTQAVSRFVEATTAGYVQAGVIPVLKHFPGHGGVAGDTHSQLVVDRSDLERIWSLYLPPFQAGLQAGAPVVMLSHVAYPAISGKELPATITPEVPDFLRGELGFEGIIMSDALDMKGLVNESLGVSEAGLRAIQSGVDVLLLNDADDARSNYQRLLSAAASGELSAARLDEAVRRILMVKSWWGLHLQPSEPRQPDWQADYDLAIQTGYQMVTRLRDRDGLIPLPAQYRNLLMVSPITSEGQETHSEFLDPVLREAGFHVEHVHYLNVPFKEAQDNGANAALAEKAPAADLLLVLTWQAYFYQVIRDNSLQVELAQAALASGKPVVMVALNSPTDLLAYPDAPSVLATYGTMDGALRALADILVGRWAPVGVNPLPALP